MLTNRHAVNELLDAIEHIVATCNEDDTPATLEAIQDARDVARYVRETFDAEY